MKLGLAQLYSYIAQKLGSGSEITASEHRDVENTIVESTINKVTGGVDIEAKIGYAPSSNVAITDPTQFVTKEWVESNTSIGGIPEPTTTGSFLRKLASGVYSWVTGVEKTVYDADIANINTSLGAKEDAGVAQSLINTHNASVDPHPQYTVTESGDYPTSNYYTDRYRVLTQGGNTISDDVPRMGKVVALDENSPLTLDIPWFISFGVLNQSVFTVYNYGTEAIELIASPEVYFNLYLDMTDRSVVLKPSQSALFVRAKLLSPDLCYSVFLNKEGTAERSGDYYVHAATGQDSAANGTISSPYKTIQYALAYTPPNNTIKILKGDYYLTGDDTLHYDGTIQLQGAIIHVNLNAGRYLINYSAGVSINGEGTIQIETADNRFLNHTNNSRCKIEGIKVLFQNQTEGPILIQNYGVKEFKNCTFSLYPNNATANIQLFNEEDLAGADFIFIGCAFSGLKLKFRNYSSNGGATIKGSTFYGTSDFGNQDNFIQVGKGAETNRILLIEDTSFDMVSLGLFPSKGVYLYEDGTEITLRNVRFVRYTGVDRYSIYTDQENCKVYAFNCTSSTPVIDVSLASNMHILPANEFKYFDNLPTYVR